MLSPGASPRNTRYPPRSVSLLLSHTRFTAPVSATAVRLFGAAGGNVSFGVTQIGLLGSLSMNAAPTGATLRTTKHCSLPGSAPACTKEVSSIGLGFSGAGAALAAPPWADPDAGTE